MGDYLEQYDGFRNKPAPLPWSREGRQMALANRQAQVDAVKMANRAALQNLKNELNHQLKQQETIRRSDRLHLSQTLAEQNMDEVSMLSRGNPNREAIHMGLFNAWYSSEVYIARSETDGGMR